MKDKKYFTVAEVAALAEVPRPNIYYAVKRSWIEPEFDYRGKVIFRKAEVERYLVWRMSAFTQPEQKTKEVRNENRN